MSSDLFPNDPFVEGLLLIAILVGAALYLGLCIGSAFWIAVDAERRDLPKWIALTLAILLFPLSPIVWLFIRNRFEATPHFNYASAEILATQKVRNPHPTAKTSQPQTSERKIRIIEEEDEEPSLRRRRRSSSRRRSSGSHSSHRRSSSNRCRKCGYKISSTVAACPRCGTKRSSE